MGNIVAFSLLVAVLTIACGPRTQRERDAGRDAPNDTPATTATHHTTCPPWTGFAYEPIDTGLDESAALDALTPTQVDATCQVVRERMRPLSTENVCSMLATPWLGACQSAYDRCVERPPSVICGPTTDYPRNDNPCAGLTVGMFEDYIAHWTEYAARTLPGSYCTEPSSNSWWNGGGFPIESNFCVTQDETEGDYAMFRCIWGTRLVPTAVE